MPADGKLEADAILTYAQANLAGGRVYASIPDDADIETLPGGKIKPFFVISFGLTYPRATGRQLSGTEADQPHMLPVSIAGFAADGEAATSMVRDAVTLFRGWVPDASDSGEMTGVGGTTYPVLDTRSAPSRWSVIGRMKVYVNR